jgi:hypothetical protein
VNILGDLNDRHVRESSGDRDGLVDSGSEHHVRPIMNFGRIIDDGNRSGGCLPGELAEYRRINNDLMST